MLDVTLIVAAAGFAVVNGLNDGAALVATGLKVPALRPAAAIAGIAAALVVGPLVLGTRVAATFADRLVNFRAAPGPLSGEAGLLAAVVAGVAVVAVLGRRGLPTSLTLALIGGIVGAGLGGGFPVVWSTVGGVLAIGVAAPVVGAVVAWALTRLAALVPHRRRARGRIQRAHFGGFALQCLAYAANDGQKMFAVLAVATGTAAAGRGAGTDLGVLHFLLLATLFAAGLVVGLPRVAATLSADVLPVRPPNAVIAELSSAGAVLGSAAVGAPVSMTQAIAGGLVGTGLAEGYRKVRWRAAAGLGLAWVMTLPASVGVAAALAGLGARL